MRTQESPSHSVDGLNRASIPSPHSYSNRFLRTVWWTVYLTLFRLSPKPLHGWRRMLLRMFGAHIGRKAVIHPSVRIWAPWHLTMDSYASMAPFVDCYNVAPITFGAYSTVSQYAHLCAASHDYRSFALPLVAKPISVGRHAWICAGAFISAGVTVGEGAVVGARSVVTRDVDAWSVVAGNPAKRIAVRTIGGN